jgi:hypothetical protein
MAKMHEHELMIDETIVKRLIDSQCSQWKDLSIQRINRVALIMRYSG